MLKWLDSVAARIYYQIVAFALEVALLIDQSSQ